MGRFFIRWTPAPGQGGYVTKTNSNRRPYTQSARHSATKSWATRKNAERFLSRKDRLWAGQCLIVEAPSCWQRRDPQTDAEWDELAIFLGHAENGASLREQIRLADELLTEIFAEEAAHA